MQMKQSGVYIGLAALALAAVWYAAQNGRGATPAAEWPWPLERGQERQKLLTFGLYVTPDPEQNPIDPPERFSGYHTALDLEIFENERNADVPVMAVCDGMLLYRGEAEGYGGVMVQSCRLAGQEVTVLYGHLDPATFAVSANGPVKTGDRLGLLGDAHTAETGNTRKHLHLGIHKGRELALLGYVQDPAELNSYLDPLSVFERK